MSTPIVTFCIVNYNQSAYIKQCFDSIRAQKIDDAEIIIIDDCSKDESVKIIEEYIERHNWVVHFIANEENKGITKNLHDAVLLAKGQYFSFLAADDFIDECRIALLLQRAEECNHKYAAYTTNYRLVDEHNNLIAEDGLSFFHPALKEKRVTNRQDLFTPKKALEYFIEFSCIPSLANLVKREVILECGNYDLSFKIEDYPLWLKLLSNYTIYYEDAVLSSYRQINSSYSRKNANSILWDEKFFMLAPYRKNQAVKDTLSKQLLLLFLRDCLQRKGIDGKKWQQLKGINLLPALGFVIKETLKSIATKVRKLFSA